MIIKNKIRQDVSQILDVLIPEGKWQAYIDRMDSNGKFTRKILIAAVMTMAQHIETLENHIEELYFLMDKNPKGREKTTFKLRTPAQIYGELQVGLDTNPPGTTAFYVDDIDWKILEKGLDPELAKTRPEYGYGKEIDPSDNEEKTCLFYKEIPIFKK